MPVMHCQLCDRPVEAQRRVTGWTHVFGILSLGLSYLAVPFYRRRCPICMSTALTSLAPAELPGRGQLQRRSELEDRLALAVDELDAVRVELDRLRAERDFYKDLSGERKGRTQD